MATGDIIKLKEARIGDMLVIGMNGESHKFFIVGDKEPLADQPILFARKIGDGEPQTVTISVFQDATN